VEQLGTFGRSRRSFLGRAGLGGGVLALGPLAASIAAEAAPAATNGAFDFDTPYNRIGTGSYKWDGALIDEGMSHIVAGMGISDMDFQCAPVVTAALAKRIRYENWGYVYMGSPGPQAFVQSIIDWNKRRHGIDAITHDNIAFIMGVHAGLMDALRAFSPKGGKVLMLAPAYGGFYEDIIASRMVANESPMKVVDGQYEIDWDDLERRMTPDTKVTILCNPHNPIGRVWSKAELARYGALCLKHRIVVLSDEIHCDFVNKGHKYTPFSTLDDKAVVANSITFTAASKSFSLGSLNLAWYFTTNKGMSAEMLSYDRNRTDIGSLNIAAAHAAQDGGEDWLNQLTAYIDGNHDFAGQYMKANIPMIRMGAKPQGTFLSWLDVREISKRIGAQKLADAENKKPQGYDTQTGKAHIVSPEEMVGHWFAKNAFVALNPGSIYGMGGAGHMRMNIATSRRTLKAALDSMAAAVKTIA
jgi:cysteine-S-conjugate beta-lyase